ncbi:M20 aminoacylase family protein [Devosia sp.]|uniref:M20 aminoacylase family protein n=1 Tax=Devosia sp. TaxID=1871048 RepID=UPI002AFF4EDE|nr:M20 aminoacylase family protein [Devosia sp.]
MPIINRVAEISKDVVAWRRHLHQYPELMYDLPKTAAFVAEKLRGFGCDEVVEAIGQTGVVAVIKGRSTASGKVIGIRADMDALPIHEESDVEFPSLVPGRMHACGHDAHTAMLLGAARHLAETRNFDGTAIIIFQPAEEGGAGARAMVEDGLLDRFAIQQVYGLHNMVNLPVGQFALRPGAMMASTDKFTITISGRGGHAARPHEAIDPVVAAASLIMNLQTIASRNVDPLQSAVITVGAVHGGDAFNVIPETAQLVGTTRALDGAVRDFCQERIEAMTHQICAAYGAKAQISYERGYPVVVNEPGATEILADAARDVGGVNSVDTDITPVMGAEDFAFMLEERPGAYIFLGIGPSAPHHHPKYKFNDEAVPYGVSLWARLIERTMPLPA